MTIQEAQKEVNNIIRQNILTPDYALLNELFSYIDLTSLNTDDSDSRIASICRKLNSFSSHFPQMNNVAALCIYPNLVSAAKYHLKDTRIKIAAVSASFPSAQSFAEVKKLETRLAVEQGAVEADIVLPAGKFLSGKTGEVEEEIRSLKSIMGDLKLKVILETGILPSGLAIQEAAQLALEAGADFIKTSTGKLTPAATPEAFYIMTNTIVRFYKEYGIRKGIKAAGGISTTEDAWKYYIILRETAGKEWLQPSFFRIGASRLANKILSDISYSIKGKKQDILYF